MEQISQHNFSEERDILNLHEIETGKELPCIIRTISVESNPVVYSVIQINSKDTEDKYNDILGRAKGNILVVGAGNMSFANKLGSSDKNNTVTLIEEEEDIFDSIINLPRPTNISIHRVGYLDFKGSDKFDLIFIDACKCLDTPKEVIGKLKGKFKQFLRKNGALVTWFDGV